MDGFRSWLGEQGKDPEFCAEYDRLRAEYDAARGVSAQDEAAHETTLEESFDILDGMLKKLEDSSLPLEEALKLYQQGTELLAKCNDKIDMVEKQIMAVNKEGGLDEFEF